VRLTSVELVYCTSTSFKMLRLVAMTTVAPTRSAAKRRHPVTFTTVQLVS